MGIFNSAIADGLNAHDAGTLVLCKTLRRMQHFSPAIAVDSGMFGIRPGYFLQRWR